jgi:acetyltransferase
MSTATTRMTGQSSDTERAAGHPLDAIFAPKTVALIGATERPGSVGRTVLRNLISTARL